MEQWTLLVFVLVLMEPRGRAVLHSGSAGGPCLESRKVHTESWGIITDGPPGSNYSQNSHCEWLIKANSSEQFISLNFTLMGTECSYDYVYVYDGDSFNSPMLGSFSGRTLPQTVVATSGFMLILLYSDTNYVLDGFRAEYYITDCPANCSSHGTCLAHSCICESGWGGVDCSQPLCPDHCGLSKGRGRCLLGRCHCFTGYSGQSCSLYKGDPVGNSWHWVYKDGVNARAAHSAIYISETDAIYVFGGYNLNTILGDLVIFRFNHSQWEDEDGKIISSVVGANDKLDARRLAAVGKWATVGGSDEWGLHHRPNFFSTLLFTSTIADNNSRTQKHPDSLNNQNARYLRQVGVEDFTLGKPTPRYSHAACNYPGGFVLHGGVLEDGSLGSDLWLYQVVGGRWIHRALNSSLQPPPLARHTLTLADDGWLYMVGGSTEQGMFSSKIFRIKLSTVGGSEEWEEVVPRGGKELDMRVVAHTTVYNPQANSLLVYAGIVTNVARFSKLSDRMFSFNLESRHWAEIHYPRSELRDNYLPRERAFHTATVIGNYMVVFGGYTHRHNKEEICYDKHLYLYHLGCHTWVTHDILDNVVNASHYPKVQGIFGHSAALRNGNTLLLFGGYHGNVNADLLAFILPPTVAVRQGENYDAEQLCSRSQSVCTSHSLSNSYVCFNCGKSLFVFRGINYLGRCTAKLIKQVQPWVEHQHGEVDYYLTMFLDGHCYF